MSDKYPVGLAIKTIADIVPTIKGRTIPAGASGFIFLHHSDTHCWIALRDGHYIVEYNMIKPTEPITDEPELTRFFTDYPIARQWERGSAFQLTAAARVYCRNHYSEIVRLQTLNTLYLALCEVVPSYPITEAVVWLTENPNGAIPAWKFPVSLAVEMFK